MFISISYPSFTFTFNFWLTYQAKYWLSSSSSFCNHRWSGELSRSSLKSEFSALNPQNLMEMQTLKQTSSVRHSECVEEKTKRSKGAETGDEANSTLADTPKVIIEVENSCFILPNGPSDRLHRLDISDAFRHLRLYISRSCMTLRSSNTGKSVRDHNTLNTLVSTRRHPRISLELGGDSRLQVLFVSSFFSDSLTCDATKTRA